jgi:lipopolysaccharide/colanic/teichoic acid biosynthesis glycosyltransferase
MRSSKFPLQLKQSKEASWMVSTLWQKISRKHTMTVTTNIDRLAVMTRALAMLSLDELKHLWHDVKGKDFTTL